MLKNKFMKKLLVLIILLSTSAYSQEKEEFPYRNAGFITFNILSPVNFDTPRYRFGYVHSFNEKIRVSLDVGYGSDAITYRGINDFINSNRQDYSLFEIRPEVYYILNPTKPVQMHLGIEVFYINHNETILNNYYQVIDTNEQVRYSQADINRQKYGSHLKFGAFIPFGRESKMGMNIYGGLGFRVRDNSFSNIQNPVDGGGNFFDDDDDDGFTDPFFRFEGATTGLSVALGFKLFYRLY